ncbi:hypothetical protein Pcinc_035973 [Petrolisthes cinctipes]|uniref:Uncharacterized protein n=1 Tax=Petrolisthes cinctipes TaxID=88211 RepID=A0AAE1BVG0_PETCI|nr:hypothetical protein Pcinc_035973 [Petrolisthes cinctipes]
MRMDMGEGGIRLGEGGFGLGWVRKDSGWVGNTSEVFKVPTPNELQSMKPQEGQRSEKEGYSLQGSKNKPTEVLTV